MGDDGVARDDEAVIAVDQSGIACLQQHACGDLRAVLGGRIDLLVFATGGDDAEHRSQRQVLTRCDRDAVARVEVGCFVLEQVAQVQGFGENGHFRSPS